jgi:mRNA interferase RelE/StbE
MTYRVEFTSSAQREFLRLAKADQQRVGRRIDALRDNPRPAGCVKLAGASNLWRLRSGDYRVVYAIEDAALIVAITRVAHRRHVYRGL